MVRTITLQNVKIRSWTVSVGGGYVSVIYDVLDDTQEVIYSGTALFFETMPEEGQTLPDGTVYSNPDDYYQLPASYIQMLTDLTVDADTAITEREIGLP